jgi:hypothetical protein
MSEEAADSLRTECPCADTVEREEVRRDGRQSNKAFAQMASGGIAGSVAKTMTAPLSRLTILYQVSPILSATAGGTGAATHYPTNLSLYDAARRIVQTEGVRAFWKGNLTSVLHRFPYSAINFTAYETSKDLLVKRLRFKESPETRLVCGALSGAVACFACYPLDLVRTRLTVQPNGAGAGAIVQTLLQVCREEGVLGLYRGLLVSLAVSVPNLAIGFSVYGSMKERCLASGSPLLVQQPSSWGNNASPADGPRDLVLSPLGCMASGAVSGCLSSLLTFPADTVRRRMQVRGLVRHGTNSVSEIGRVFRTEGVRGLYRGILPELLKVTPMVGFTFCVYEASMRFLTA